MEKIFDFENMSGVEITMIKTWAEFREALANNEFRYDDTEKAKKTIFLKVYDELFHQHDGIQYLTKRLEDFECLLIGRGTILGIDEKLDYERFIPKKEYIKSDNRFSPAGVEWLYLALGNSRDEALFCSQKECRANTGSRFGFCSFGVAPNFADAKIVDLSVADTIDFDDLNAMLEIFGQLQSQKAIKFVRQRGVIPKAPLNEVEFVRIFKLWVVNTYTKLLSEQIFVPILSADKKLEYTPFQTLAQYFISLGYCGIVYGSTVSNKGKNIVLFDKRMAMPYGIINDFVVKG